MRFIKFKLITILFIVIVLTACGNTEMNKSLHLKKGEAYLKKGNLEKARIEFKNSLQIDPKYAEGYYMLGLLEQRARNFRLAFYDFKKAIELNPQHIKALAKLARIYLLSNDLDNANKNLEVISKIDIHNMDGKLLRLVILSRTKDKEAITYAESILSEDASQAEAVRILAMLYMKSKESDKAIKVLVKGISDSPAKLLLRKQLADIYSRIKDYENSEKVLKNIIKVEPLKFNHQLNLASFYTKRNRLDEAEDVLSNIILISPNNVKGYLYLAEFQDKRKNRNGAIQTILSGIDKNPDLVELKFSLARLYADIKLEKSIDIYEEIIRSNEFKPEAYIARNELSKIALMQNDLDQAKKLSDEVLENNPGDNNALLIKGTVSLIRGDYSDAISAYRAVVKEQPGHIKAILSLSSAHVNSYEPELALEVLRQGIIESPGNSELYINYASLLLDLGDPVAAENVVDKLLVIHSRNLAALKMKVTFSTMRNDMNETKIFIEKIKVSYPDIPDGYQLIANYYVATQQYKEAFLEYENALSKSPELLPSLASIVMLHIKLKEFDKASNRLTGFLKNQPDNAVIYELLGEVFLAQKKYSAANDAINKAVLINNKWPLPYISLASIALAKDDVDEAIQIYKRALEVLPNNTDIMAKLADIHKNQNNRENAILLYEAILKNDPVNVMAINNLAVILADDQSNANNLQRAKDLAIKFENSKVPAFLDVLGWIYYKLGEFDKAVSVLERVVNKARHVPIFNYHMGMAYYRSNNLKSAKIYLSNSLESGGSFQGREEAKRVMHEL